VQQCQVRSRGGVAVCCKNNANVTMRLSEIGNTINSRSKRDLLKNNAKVTMRLSELVVVVVVVVIGLISIQTGR
jgi:hypothetical protein